MLSVRSFRIKSHTSLTDLKPLVDVALVPQLNLLEWTTDVLLGPAKCS